MLSVIAFAEPLAPDRVFNVGPLPVTNSMLFGVLVAVFIVAIFYSAARASQLWPKSKLSFYIETFVDLIFGLIVDSFGDRKKATRHFPLLITLFVFILACNLSGLLPGVDTIKLNVNGEHVSLLRSWTTDLNSTLALAVLSLTIVHTYAIKELGGVGYFKHFFTSWKPMSLFISFNEVFGEILRLVTLSLRLFGVIYGGEVLLFAIAELSGNAGWVAPLPIFFLEIFFSLVQAYLFMMLTTTYLVMATAHTDQDESHKQQPVAA